MFQYLSFPLSETHPAWFFILSLTLVIALYTDLKSRTIPNWLTAGGFLAMFVFLVIAHDLEILKNHGLSVLFGSLILVPLFIFRWFGGGDVKLLFFVCLAFSFEYLFSVFFWVFLTGGFQGAASFLFYKKKPLPYAIAITGGVLIYLLISTLGY